MGSKRQRWSPERVEERLAAYIEQTGTMPRAAVLKRTDPPLADAVSRYGGFRYWGCRMGFGHEYRTEWTPELVQQGLAPHIKKLGRMPTASELSEAENGWALAVAVVRYGGYRHWAKVLGVLMKESTTARGHDWEDHEEKFFRELGLPVERQTSKAPFDLRVNGHRVDVKSAEWVAYEEHHVRGHIFGGLKRGEDCDFFDLLCLEENQVKHRFIIPASVARVTMLTITERQLGGYGKYSQYQDRIDLLE